MSHFLKRKSKSYDGTPPRTRRTSRARSEEGRPVSAWNLAMSMLYHQNGLKGKGIPLPVIARIMSPIYRQGREQGLQGEELAHYTVERVRRDISHRMPELQALSQEMRERALSARRASPRSRSLSQAPLPSPSPSRSPSQAPLPSPSPSRSPRRI